MNIRQKNYYCVNVRPFLSMIFGLIRHCLIRFNGFGHEPNQRANTPTIKEWEWVAPLNGKKEVLVQVDRSDGTGVDHSMHRVLGMTYKLIESFLTCHESRYNFTRANYNQ